MYKTLIALLILPISLVATPFVDALNTGSMNLFYLYGKVGYNRVYSPFAVNSALLALYCGAAESSEEHLRSLYMFSTPQSIVPSTYYTLYKKLDRSVFLLNSFWVSSDVALRTRYQEMLSHYFKTQILGVNLSNLPQTTRIINSFALNKLTNQVRPFVSVSNPFSLLSVNGLNYSLKWQSPFLTKYSEHRLFYPKSGESPSTTRMMSKLGRFKYYENESFQVVAIPLEKKELNNRLQLLIYLPKPHVSDEPFEYAYQSLPHTLAIPSLLKPTNLYLQIPSFEFQMDASFGPTLSAFETQTELSPSANFSLISGKTSLYLSDMITTTRISINEYGLGVPSGNDEDSLQGNLELHPKERSIPFNANRPFMYMVHDADDNLILTIGIYTSPKIVVPPPPPEIKQTIVPPPPPPPPPPQDTPTPKPQPFPPSSGNQNTSPPSGNG
ncbi:MAG: serpin family protein [Simkaniaceae bacterium]|nr:serpin family protein [Simkaniaceae bacterium]